MQNCHKLTNNTLVLQISRPENSLPHNVWEDKSGHDLVHKILSLSNVKNKIDWGLVSFSKKLYSCWVNIMGQYCDQNKSGWRKIIQDSTHLHMVCPHVWSKNVQSWSISRALHFLPWSCLACSYGSKIRWEPSKGRSKQKVECLQF